MWQSWIVFLPMNFLLSQRLIQFHLPFADMCHLPRAICVTLFQQSPMRVLWDTLQKICTQLQVQPPRMPDFLARNICHLSDSLVALVILSLLVFDKVSHVTVVHLTCLDILRYSFITIGWYEHSDRSLVWLGRRPPKPPTRVGVLRHRGSSNPGGRTTSLHSANQLLTNMTNLNNFLYSEHNHIIWRVMIDMTPLSSL